MKKVLIALDYNPTAQKVAEQGYALAKVMGAEVYIMHVVADSGNYTLMDYSPIMGFTGYVALDPLRNSSAESLIQSSRNFLNQARNHLYDETIQTLVKEGNTADEILNTATELEADIIVIGSHSRKWLEKIVMGSVAKNVLSHTRIPLFIIPTKRNV